MTSVAKAHGIHLYSRLKVDDARAVLQDHECDSCADLCTITKLYPKPPPRARKNPPPPPSAAQILNEQERIKTKARELRFQRRSDNGTLTRTEFPPDPLPRADIHRILTGSANALLPERFIEGGCAVCGLLTPLKALSDLQAYTGALDLLHGEAVTRRERFSSDDPIEDLPGPVLADGCKHICVTCEKYLSVKKVPPNALVRHCWLGKVPEQLTGLSYAESVMIARIRHNRCVVRVNSGRVRMHANTIMFAQPALKVYKKLPPSRAEMNEVLAFVFTGSSAPTQEDFDRTPMLVRRDKVARALEWLKLNHEGYSDLEISEENLQSYALKDVPVVVDFRRTKADPSDSIPTIARSVFDKGEEHGTENGKCTFAVHGLSSAE
ncbi:hypothetical protein C8R46DRAFT_851822, partial [Mycena filopes]